MGEVLVNPPAAGGRPHVLPGELGEAGPLVVDEVLVFVTLASLQRDDLDALLRKLIAESAAARARSHDDDDAVVVQIEFRCHVRFLA